ncbi:PAS domain S-box protein [Arsukibacterium sp.]|uniref:PAS domain S-box protein n=1 Tax=Arsukibacterium sp. TaxID=1977258 RepID=UPI0035651EE6
MFSKISLNNYLMLLWLGVCAVSFTLIVITMMVVNHSTVHQVQETLHQRASSQIYEKIDSVLRDAEAILEFNKKEITRLVEQDRLLEEFSSSFFDQISSFKYVDGIFFGAENGQFTGYSRIARDTIQLMQVTDKTDGAIEFYDTDSRGRTTELATRKATFNTTQRPWYLDALNNSEPVWGKMFIYHALPRYAFPLSVKIFDENNMLAGVFGINLFADFIDELLVEQLITPSDHLFIIDSTGNIISQAKRNVLRRAEQHYQTEGFVKRVAETYQQQEGKKLELADESVFLDVEYDKQSFSVNVSLLQYGKHYHWIIVNGFNNDAYLQPIKASHNNAIISLMLLFLLILSLVYLLTQRIINGFHVFLTHINRVYVKQQDGQLILNKPELPVFSKVIELRQIAAEFDKLTKRLSESLQQQNSSTEQMNRLASVVQTASDMVVICDKNGLIEWTNASFERVSGYSLAACRGKQPGKLLQGVDTDRHTVEVMSKTLAAKQMFSGRLLNYRADGEPYWIELSIHPVLDDKGDIKEYFSLQRDISRQVAFEKELNVWKHIFHGARWGIAISRGAGVGGESATLGEHNPHFAYMLGYAPGELLGRKLTTIYAAEEHEKLPRFIQRIAQDGFVSFESVMLKKDGSRLPVLVNVSQVINPDGSEEFRVANIQDLTEIKALEKQLRESNKMEALGALTRGIVHDFNNILAATIVNAEMCQLLLKKQSRKVAAPLDPALNNIISASERAAELIKQVLLFSRNEKQEHTEVSLVKVLEGVNTLISANLKCNVTLIVNNQTSDDMLNLKGNSSQLHQLFINLLSNGADAIGETGRSDGVLKVEMSIVDHTEYFALANFDYWIKVNVTDNGCGIDQALFEKMFEPLFTTKEEGKGTGLGLSLVQNIVQNHQGFVTCESEPKVGTVFSVYLPYEKFNQLTPDDNSVSEAPSLKHTGSLTVLVDDNADFLLTLAKLLDQQHIDNKCFTSPSLAQQFFQHHAGDIELVFVDFNMPGMNGIELATALRQYNTTCFIVLVSSGYPQDYAKALDQGVINSFIMKPLTLRRVLDAIEQNKAHLESKAADDKQ